MKIYIIERDNPEQKPEPEICLDGNLAKETVRKEYLAEMKDHSTSQEKADAGYGAYGCYWNFEPEDHCGDALISSDYDADRWEWRITCHEINIPQNLLHGIQN